MEERTLRDRFMDEYDNFYRLRGRIQHARLHVSYLNEFRTLEREFYNHCDFIQLEFRRTPIGTVPIEATSINERIVHMAAINARIEHILRFPPRLFREDRFGPSRSRNVGGRNFRQ